MTDRILFIMGNMGLGGAETHIMKVFRKVDRSKFQFDFILNVPQKCHYEEEIISLGGRVFRVTPKKQSVFKNFFDIYKIVKNNNYRTVLKCGEQAMSWTDMLAAKIGGASKRIMRSTNSKASDSTLCNLMHYLSILPLDLLTSIKVAPSIEAGTWLFGKWCKEDIVIINNGLDLHEYQFNDHYRNYFRNKLKIPNDCIVVGHVGRFNTQKNHDFLIDLFSIYNRHNSNSRLLLVGDGPLVEQMKEKVSSLDLSDYVIFTGNISYINKLYSAMDLFVFPSIFEGMPNTVIEAQANGLRCYVSDSVTTKCNITGQVSFISIDDVRKWVTEIQRSNIQRYDSISFFQKRKYTIDDVVLKYVEIFEK